MALTTIPSAGAKLRASVLSALITELRPLYASKAANETVNNTATLQNDDDLFAAVEANDTYHFELRINYTSGTTPDLKHGFTFPAGTTIRWSGTDTDTAGAVRVTGNLTEASVPAICGSGGDLMAVYTGRIITSTTAGTLQWQWAQNTANVSNSTVYAGSFLVLHRML